jgi:Holliday junction resolvasome RuvABC endonuclease subunit
VVTVVGIDMSLTSTGVSFEDQQFVIAPSVNGVERLKFFADEFTKIFDSLDNAAVVIEGYSFASRNSHAHSLGELGGILKLTLFNAGVPLVIVPPTSRAKFATGKGNASKSEVVSAISAKTGIVWQGKGADDKCDAWVLEEIGRFRLGTERYVWPKQNIEGLDKVDFSDLDKVSGRESNE